MNNLPSHLFQSFFLFFVDGQRTESTTTAALANSNQEISKLKIKLESLTQDLSDLKLENESLQRGIKEGTVEYQEMEAENVLIIAENEQREKDCVAALDSLLVLQAQFQDLQLERETEQIERDKEISEREALQISSNEKEITAEIAATENLKNIKSYTETITELQDKINQSEIARTGFQIRTADLSKVLRTSQTRTEELLEENARYSLPDYCS